MSDCTSSEDNPFFDTLDTLDPTPNPSLLGLSISECSILASTLPIVFKMSHIPTFFMKAAKHDGVVCLTSIDYRLLTKAHMGQTATINKLRSDNDHLNHRLTCSIDLNGTYCKEIDSLTAEIALIKTKLQSAAASLFSTRSHVSMLSWSLEDVKDSNQQLQKEIQLLTMPTPTSSASTQTISMPTIDTATQATPATTSATAQTTTTTKTDSIIQTDPATTLTLPRKPIPAATLPSVTQPMSYTQAMAVAGLSLTPSKPGLSKALAKFQATERTLATQSATSPSSSELVFKG